MANTGIKEILCENTLVFCFTLMMFTLRKYLEGVLELQPLQESPEWPGSIKRSKMLFQNTKIFLPSFSLQPSARFLLLKDFLVPFPHQYRQLKYDIVSKGNDCRVKIICSLMMWSSILVTISPCCSTSIARSMNIEWISVIPSSNLFMSLCLCSNQSDLWPRNLNS